LLKAQRSTERYLQSQSDRRLGQLWIKIAGPSSGIFYLKSRFGGCDRPAAKLIEVVIDCPNPLADLVADRLAIKTGIGRYFRALPPQFFEVIRGLKEGREKNLSG